MLKNLVKKFTSHSLSEGAEEAAAPALEPSPSGGAAETNEANEIQTFGAHHHLRRPHQQVAPSATASRQAPKKTPCPPPPPPRRFQAPKLPL